MLECLGRKSKTSHSLAHASRNHGNGGPASGLQGISDHSCIRHKGFVMVNSNTRFTGVIFPTQLNIVYYVKYIKDMIKFYSFFHRCWLIWSFVILDGFIIGDVFEHYATKVLIWLFCMGSYDV